MAGSCGSYVLSFIKNNPFSRMAVPFTFPPARLNDPASPLRSLCLGCFYFSRSDSCALVSYHSGFCLVISDIELLFVGLSAASPLNSSVCSGLLIPAVNDPFPTPQLISVLTFFEDRLGGERLTWLAAAACSFPLSPRGCCRPYWTHGW